MLSGTLLSLLIAALAVVVFFDVITLSFSRLGLPPWATILLFVASFVGSRVNVPIWQSAHTVPGHPVVLHRFFFYTPPYVTNQVVAINVGGAVIPMLLSLWLLTRTPILRTVCATIAVAVVSHAAASVVPGRGVVMPVWIAPVTAALLGLILTRGHGAAPLAYIAGTMGALIGADLLNLPRLYTMGSGVLSIGGAGVFDGVFLAGLVAVLISFERPRRPKYPRPVNI